MAPYGLAAVVTGQASKDSEPATQKLIDEWKQFYILKDRHYHQYQHGDTPMPAAVEVVVCEYSLFSVPVALYEWVDITAGYQVFQSFTCSWTFVRRFSKAPSRYPAT